MTLPEPIRFHAANPGPYTGDGNSTWLIDGRRPTLVDAGVGELAHLDALQRHLAGRPLVRALVTHGHSDHISGAAALRQRWPAIELCTGAPPDPSWRMIADGESLEAGDGVVEAILTPGHARDHLCFWDAGRAYLYSGDMLIEGASVLIPSGKGGNLRNYLRSLEHLAALRPRRAFPGHGPAIDNPAVVIEAHIARRRQREADVMACLADGLQDADAIVARLYPGLPADRVAAARMTIDAHLEKLRADGRL